MDLSDKQASKMFAINLVQTLLSAVAFIIVTYILINVDNEKLIFLILDIVIIGFIADGVFNFIKTHKSL